MRRGQVQMGWFLVGIIIAVVVVAFFVMFLSGFFSGVEEEKLASVSDDFNDIAQFYERCSESSKKDCYCGAFSVSGIVDQGFSLYLNKFLGQSHLILTEVGIMPGSDEIIDDEDILIQSSFDENLVCTWGYEGFRLSDTSHRVYGLTGRDYGLTVDGGMIDLLKSGSSICVYGGLGDNDMDVLRRDYPSCYAELDKNKLVLLDSAGDAASSQISSYLYDYSVESVGRTDAYFRGGYEDRAEWFDDVYVRENKDFLDSGVYLVHVGTSVDSTVAPNLSDSLVLHYLEGSVVGESFARALGLRFSALRGKYYYNSMEESVPGTVPEKYRFNFEVEYEANNLTNPDGVYLVCEGDALPVCREKLQVPAVFIEIVDKDDGFSAFQGHEQVIAGTIGEGLLDFVRTPTVFEPPSGADEPLFG